MRKRCYRKRRIAAYLICIMMLFTGCSWEATEEIPELVESLINNDAYRPVTYGTIGDIGNLEDVCGVVVPEEEAYFFTATTKIEELYVDVGDYVRQGDVLATINTEETEKTIEDLQTALKYCQSIYEQEEKIYEETMAKYDYQIKAYQEADKQSGTKQAISDLKSAKAVEKEDHVYDELLYERECRLLKEQISEQQELLAQSKLTARTSGYVTYVKDVSSSAETQVAETIVVVADYSKKYIEVSDHTVEETAYTEAESVYTNYNGTRYELSLFSYSQEELAAMQATKEYPYIKYEIPDGMDLEIGDLLPVCYTKKNISNVLIIGLDSVYEEGNDTFVYVKTEDSDKERRDITTGSKDQHYIEVTSGLEEGELVYYISNAMTPANYEVVEVELSDFSTVAKGSNYTLANTRDYYIWADESVTVTDVMVDVGDTVKEGDVIYKVSAERGKADLLAASNEIQAEEDAYKQTSADYRQQIKDIEEQIKAAKASDTSQETSKEAIEAVSVEAVGEAAEASTEEVSGSSTEESTQESAEEASEASTEEMTTEETEAEATETEVTKTETTEAEEDTEETTEEEDIVTADQLYQVEQLSCDKRIATAVYRIATLTHEQTLKELQEDYNNLKEVNDGDGYRYIYAERDGVITALNGVVDRKISEGTYLYIISEETTDKISVSFVGDTAKLNQEISFVGDEQTYTGVCIAAQADTEKTYYTTIDGQVYSSSIYTDPEQMTRSVFYVRMKEGDESLYENMDAKQVVYEAVSMKNAIVLPSGMVYSETDKLSGDTYNYVWKVMDGSLVKQFVTVSTTMKADNKIVVLAGVEVGDHLAREGAVATEEEEDG